MNDQGPSEYAVQAAVLSDCGTRRAHNEDHCGLLIDLATTLLVVADGVSGALGGDVASRAAVEVLLEGYKEQPPGVALGKRLLRAAQRANIEIHERSMIVTELRGMATTLTAFAVERAQLHAVHAGDCRLYRIRGGRLTQLTKDHTVVAERMRLGILSKARALHHPDRSIITRSLGPDLIVAFDRITAPLEQHDVLVCCSDGLYNVLPEATIATIAYELPPELACQALIDEANAAGTPDNLTAAVLRVTGAVPSARPSSLATHVRRLLGRGP